jgi:hypothetical protein
MGRGIRWFDTALRPTTIVLAVATAIAVPGVTYGLASGAGVGFDTVVEPPFTIDAGPLTMASRSGGDVSVVDARHVADRGAEVEQVEVAATMSVADDDRDARVVLLLTFAALLAIVWTGLVSLRRIVRSARDREPFDHRNVGRLRRLGGVAIAAPIVVWASSRAFEATVDVEERFSLRPEGMGFWPWLTAGLGFLALAEVFREGAALRDLERSTI